MTDPNSPETKLAAYPLLLEACQTFAEWFRREEEGMPSGIDRNTPEGEQAWREWFDGNVELCRLAQERARRALAHRGHPAPSCVALGNLRPGTTLIYNDGRLGHSSVRAVVLAVDQYGMTVQFEDDAGVTRIRFSDREWMRYLTVEPATKGE